MKKFTIILLCFVLTAALLTACRSKDPAETDSPTTAPTTATTATQPSAAPSMPSVLPQPSGSNENGDTGMMDDATNGRNNGESRHRRGIMPNG